MEEAPIVYRFEDAPKEAHIEFELPRSFLLGLPGSPSVSDFDIELSNTTVRIAPKGRGPIIEGKLWAPIRWSADRFQNKSTFEIVTTKTGVEFVQRFYKQVVQPWPCPIAWSRNDGATSEDLDLASIDSTSLLYLSAVTSDKVKALQLLVNSADKNNEDAMLTVADVCSNNLPLSIPPALTLNILGNLPNFPKARQLYERAVKLHDSLSAMVGLVYVSNQEGDKAQASQWLARATSQEMVSVKNATALLQVAQLYEEGNVVSMDLEKAVKFYQKAKQANPRLPEIPPPEKLDEMLKLHKMNIKLNSSSNQVPQTPAKRQFATLSTPHKTTSKRRKSQEQSSLSSSSEKISNNKSDKLAPITEVATPTKADPNTTTSSSVPSKPSASAETSSSGSLSPDITKLIASLLGSWLSTSLALGGLLVAGAIGAFVVSRSSRSGASSAATTLDVSAPPTIGAGPLS